MPKKSPKNRSKYLYAIELPPCSDGLAADLGDLGLRLLQPPLGPLHGVVVVLGLAANAQEAVGEAVGAGQQLVVGLGNLRHLDGDLRLGLLEVARPHLDPELVQAGGVFLVEGE